MVQRKVSNKIGIRADHVKSDKQQLLSLRPSSPQTHDLKKKMKKSRPVKENLRSSPPLRKEKTQPGKPPPPVQELQTKNGTAATPQKQSPNYMKSTTSSEARKDRSSISVSSRASSIVDKTASPKNSDKPKASKTSTARISSLKLVRTLTKTTSFKPSRPSKKCSPVALCEDLDAQRATCSSTLKDSKFPDYLQLSPGGTESEGTSVMKVCPFTYCSLNGHHHAPLPPLRCFLSARRRALKTQKSFKLGCLSPRQMKPVEKQSKEIGNPVEEVDVKGSLTPFSSEDESPDFFVEIYSKDCEGDGEQDSGGSEMDWAAGCFSASGLEDTTAIKSLETENDVVPEAEILESGEERLYEGIQGLYDEESVSSGAWLEEEDGDSDSGDSCQQTETNREISELSPATAETEVNSKMYEAQGNESTVDSIDKESKATCGDMNAVPEAENELPSLDLPVGDDHIKCNSNYEEEETTEVKTSQLPGNKENPENDHAGTDKRHTIVYNFIQVHISVFVNQKGTEGSGTDQGVPVQEHTAADVTCETEIKEVDVTKLIKEVDVTKLMAGGKSFELLQGFNDIEEDKNTEGNDEGKLTATDEVTQINQIFADEEALVGEKVNSSNEQSDGNDGENQDDPDEQCNESEEYNRSNSMSSEGCNNSENVELQGTEHIKDAVEEMDLEYASKSDEEVTTIAENFLSGTERKNSYLRKAKTSNQELSDPSKALRRSTGRKTIQDSDSLRDFNPRGPNFLPLVPDPDAETVDLRHQMIDERKNAEEWMVDFALQQAVTKLAPARKRKVALLVEAFEKVIPTPKYETHLRHTSEAFTHARPMQACN